MSDSVLLPYFAALESGSAVRWQGRVTQTVGNVLESAGPPCSLGECCQIEDAAGHVYSGEVVGFRGTTVLTLPLEKPSGVRYGDSVIALGSRPSLPVGEELIGRVIDGTDSRWIPRAVRNAVNAGPWTRRRLWRWSGGRFASPWAAEFAP